MMKWKKFCTIFCLQELTIIQRKNIRFCTFSFGHFLPLRPA